MSNNLPVVILGGGPIGLAAAAHLAAHNISFILLEKGPRVGNTVLQWAHVKMFSSWPLNIDNVATKLLKSSGWEQPAAEQFPTGGELVHHYLEPLAEIPTIKEHLLLNHEVINISRKYTAKSSEARADKPFEVTVTSDNKEFRSLLARAVIDASGTWDTPNPIGGNGYIAIGESLQHNVYHGMPDISSAAGQDYIETDVAVVGSGHSAITALMDIVRHKKSGSTTWVVRSKRNQIIKPVPRPRILPERSTLSEGIHTFVEKGLIKIVDEFFTEEIVTLHSGRLLLKGKRFGKRSAVEADRVVACTGSRPHTSMTRELQLSLDPYFECPMGVSELILKSQKAGEAIPEPHGIQALRHPEPDYFIVGMKSHGRASNFFLMSGYEQVRSICAHLAGDDKAATTIQFEYPQDGACGSACGDGNCCNPSNLGRATPDTASCSEGCGGGTASCCG